MLDNRGMEKSMKKEYTKPQVISRGNLAELTKGTGGFFGDNQSAAFGGGTGGS